MKRSYQDVIQRAEEIALAHPQVNSVDTGRELEFDVKKSNLWPRVFIKPLSGQLNGGQGSMEFFITAEILVMDRLNVKRSNMVDVHNETFSIMAAYIATLNSEQILRIEDSPTFVPVADYQDTQTAGWQLTTRIYLDSGLECYPVT